MKRFILATVATAALISGAGFSTSAKADDNRRWNNGYHNDHDSWHDEYRMQPRHQIRVYSPPKVVYVYPRSYYPANSYYQTYSVRPAGYVPAYRVGGYLPSNRRWQPMPDYVRYGLPAPRRGEHWVYDNRDAVLVADATSRIVSGLVLAASIN